MNQRRLPFVGKFLKPPSNDRSVIAPFNLPPNKESKPMQRTIPLPQKLGGLVAVLQELLDKGESPDTVVSVFDADLSSYQPVSLACYGDGRLTLNYDDDYDDEIPRWQSEIRKLLVSECGQEVDGSGCDSGDPLDLTLTEIQLAFNAVKAGTVEQCGECLAMVRIGSKHNCPGSDLAKWPSSNEQRP